MAVDPWANVKNARRKARKQNVEHQRLPDPNKSRQMARPPTPPAPKPRQAVNRGPARNRFNVEGSEIPRLFEGERAFVMATGPSLDQDTVNHIYSLSGWRYIGISDCYRVCPFVDFYYACDQRWWDIHYQKVKEWAGSKNGYWCTEDRTKNQYPDLSLIRGGGGKGWSNQQNRIHYGSNSGYQILNIAYLLGITTMVLVGYNMTLVDKQAHFFGDHPKGLSRNTSYQSFAANFKTIQVPEGIDVINTAQPTKLDAFPIMSLEHAIRFADEKHG